MGTIVDYAYRFDGSPKAIASARAAIAAIQAKYAEVSCNGCCYFDKRPKRLKDGALSWACYATGGMDDFEASVAVLTRNSDLRCHAYWGCTDGESASALSLIERGERRKLGGWRADIGIEAALAIEQLSVKADVDALLALVDALRGATNDGWDEDDYPWLLKAALVGAVISMQLSKHQELIDDARVAKALLRIKNALADARDDLNEFRAGSAAHRAEVDKLLSTIEGLEIAQAVPAPRPRARRAMAL